MTNVEKSVIVTKYFNDMAGAVNKKYNEEIVPQDKLEEFKISQKSLDEIKKDIRDYISGLVDNYLRMKQQQMVERTDAVVKSPEQKQERGPIFKMSSALEKKRRLLALKKSRPSLSSNGGFLDIMLLSMISILASGVIALFSYIMTH